MKRSIRLVVPLTLTAFLLVASLGASVASSECVAPYCPAPSATTKAATNVAPRSATLNGTINPGGGATTYYFQYGTSTAFGKRTSTASAGAGTGTINVSAKVTGLVVGTKYHFRIVAVSPGGTTNGSDLTFTTGRAIIVSVSPRHIKAPPYTYTISGRIVTSANACSGTLSLVVKLDTNPLLGLRSPKSVATATGRVRTTCRFSITVKLTTSEFTANKFFGGLAPGAWEYVSFYLRFNGNRTLQPAQARTQNVLGKLQQP